MASAQLSSPHRAGAGSDLRETAPRRPWSPAQGAARRKQGPGGAWPPIRGTTRGWAGWYNQAAPAPKPIPASKPAAQCQWPGRRARQDPPPAPTTHRGRGAVQRVPGENFPVAPPQSRVQHSCVVPGLESRSPAGSGLRATQKLLPSWAARAQGRAQSRSRPSVQGTPWTPLLARSRARGACRPPYQPSKE